MQLKIPRIRFCSGVCLERRRSIFPFPEAHSRSQRGIHAFAFFPQADRSRPGYPRYLGTARTYSHIKTGYCACFRIHCLGPPQPVHCPAVAVKCAGGSADGTERGTMPFPDRFFAAICGCAPYGVVQKHISLFGERGFSECILILFRHSATCGSKRQPLRGVRQHIAAYCFRISGFDSANGIKCRQFHSGLLLP